MSAANTAESADFRGPLDITRAATAVLDAESTVIGWSPAAAELLGYGPAEALGRPLSAFLSVHPVGGRSPRRDRSGRGDRRVRGARNDRGSRNDRHRHRTAVPRRQRDPRGPRPGRP
nr:PAS domain-containing protein [Streptomyces sp. Termitarium-T10T-6]